MNLHVANRERYASHRASGPKPFRDLLLPALFFGSAGAIAWAIRGTDGWGGIDGTIVPGMLWGLLWYYVCWRKGIACHGAPLWLGLGIALGGELGYGQYVSWIQGVFRVEGETMPVAPWQGWLWFFLCGIGWGAPGGAMLGWALSGRSSWKVWAARLTVPFAAAALGWLLVQWFPALFFPNHGLGIYTGDLGSDLERTVHTNTQNFTVVAWWAGLMLVAALQRDKTTLVTGALIGGGFGFGFAIAAAWCLGYACAPQYIDWWKMWELHAGFNLGALYAVALYWCVRQADRTHAPDGAPLDEAAPTPAVPPKTWCARVALETLAVFLFVMTIYLERQPWTSLGMALLYTVFMAWLLVAAARGLAPELRQALRGRLSLLFCVFLFLFVTLSGATTRIGLFLELYPPGSAEQYSWPLRRVLLFTPMGAAVVAWTVYQMARALWPPVQAPPEHEPARLANRATSLMTGLAVIGAVSIWPAKVGVLYALFLAVAIWAFNRFNAA